MSDWRSYSSSGPRAVENGLKARTSQGAIGKSWWSRRFLDVLESFAIGGRLARGKTYARKGQVISLEVTPGRVAAQVQGSRARPYAVSIGLAVFDEDVWDRAEVALSEQALPSAKLLAGEVPPELEDLFAEAGAPLFPEDIDELDQDCSCPDWGIPCKHLAATFYLLAEAFDDDPFLILRWRGRDRDELLARLRELRGDAGTGDPVEPAALVAGTALALGDLSEPVGGMDRFWQPGPPLPPRPAVMTVEPDLMLRQLPEPDGSLGGEVLINQLRPAYQRFGADRDEGTGVKTGRTDARG